MNDYDSDMTGTYDRDLDERLRNERQAAFNRRRIAQLSMAGKCVECEALLAECVCRTPPKQVKKGKRK